MDTLFNLKNVDPQRININFQNPMSGSTALILAAGRGNLKLVQTLIYWNANPHARINHQMTPFYCACSHGNVEVAEFLSPYVTRKELGLRQAITGNTPKAELEELLLESLNKQKYHDLLKIVSDIELRHLVQDRINEEAMLDLMDTEE